MKRLVLLWLCTSLLAACDPLRCPKGYAPAGDKCRPRLDAGSDEDPISGEDSKDSGNGTSGRSDAAVDRVDGNAPSDGDASVADAGFADAGSTPKCFVDRDGDGVGAGPAVQCSDIPDVDAGGLDASQWALVDKDGDCDDDDPLRSPSLSDVCGDNIDNDCDNVPDDEANNACQGPCTAQLAHQPGESCNNGLLGACARTGEYVCQGNNATACNAASASGSNEVCGDSIDNDCDGSKDEADAVDAKTWFQDCDEDGYAASTSGSTRACTTPAALSQSCKSWVTTVPALGSTQDCNDANTAYRPGAGFGLPSGTSANPDLNCDGISEKEDSIYYEDQNPNDFWGPLHSRCAACGCAHWLNSSGSIISTQPSCSLRATESYPAQLTANAGVTCNTFTVNALQRCR